MFTRTSSTRKKWIRLILTLSVLVLMIGSAKGQTTQFAYQGKLGDNGNPANGQYDFQIKLFDTATVGTGTQQGSTLTVPNVLVSAGIFTVQLDFGSAVFPGADRFLEIAVKPAGGPTFTVLSPRQPVTSTPYTVRSATAGSADTATNATQLGGLAASGFIQNTTSQQTATDFNIGGSGTASILNAATQFNLGGNRILSNAGTDNLFVGIGAGANNAGVENTFFGKNAGQTNTTAATNSFFGYNAGLLNTTGSNNAFFGGSAGKANTTGFDNAFFGHNAGINNTTAGTNSFFGSEAGFLNTTGQSNAFFGRNAGRQNTTACCNSFFGASAGQNATGASNSFFGANAGISNTTGVDNSFFGAFAGSSNTTGGSNSFFGESAGGNNTTGINNAFFGRDAGVFNTTGANNVVVGFSTGFGNTTGSNITLIGTFANVGADNLSNASAIGAGAVVSSSNTVVLGRSADTVQVPGALNVTGTFGANILNATTQYNLGGFRILSNAGTDNLFAGIGAGNNTTGNSNSFFGAAAGFTNTTGDSNSFFGVAAGRANTGGGFNSFFGAATGFNNTIGSNNAFFGDSAGVRNTRTNNNTFIGSSAGFNNGLDDGTNNANSNTFIGSTAGFNNKTGRNNTFIGANAGNPNTATQVNDSVAIGSGATVSTSNTIVLGTSAETTRVPGKVVMGAGPVVSGGVAQTFDTGNFQGIFTANLVLFTLNDILPSPVHVCTRSQSLGGGFGGEALTRCTSPSSPSQYKTNMQPFLGGLDVINRLKPVTFKWKDGAGSDFGLNAEEVAEVEPLLITRNEKGEVEDVKEGSFNVLFINAFKEQQQEIETLKKRLQDFDALKSLVCADHPAAAVCKSN